jgi:zinc transport system permease protein
MENFLIRAILVGLGLVSAMCPLGCVVLWRRLSYFVDAIAHASLLGIVIGLSYRHLMHPIIIVFSMIFACILFLLRREQSTDALITIFSYVFLSLGLFLLVFIPHNTQIDLFSFLFGDVLLASWKDIAFIGTCTCLLLVWFYFRWQHLLLLSISEDLAVIEGINPRRIEFEFMMIVAFFIALSISIVGVLLIVALLVIPASAARNLSSSAKDMLILSVFMGAISFLVGIGASYYLDTPSGPSIVLASTIIFIMSLALKPVMLRRY